MEKNKTKIFIEKALLVHGDKYSYEKTDYTTVKEKVVIKCNKHDRDFYQTPDNHLRGQGCPFCKKDVLRDNRESFIIKANKVHNNKYNYNDTIYNGSNELVTSLCELHGYFTQTATSHLQGRGCAKCGESNKGYSRTKFISASKNKTGTLYLLKCFSLNEEFYKIGITSKTIKERFRKTKIPYSYEVVESYESDSGEIYDLEKKILKEYKKFKYKPKISFCGKNECFSIKPIINI